MKTSAINTIIIDDEPDARAVLRRLIGRYCPMLEVCAEAGSVAAGLEAIQQHRPGLVFLDINLNGASGFDLLKAFPNPDFKIIFVTAHDEYAIEAFKVRALHYLLKPIDPQDLIAAVRELNAPPGFWPEYHLLQQSLQSPDQNAPLILPSIQGQVVINPEEISYFVAEDKYASVVLNTGEKIFVGQSLTALTAHLPPGVFLRPHQSYIVRADAIRKVQKTGGLSLVLKDKTVIPVSRRNKEEVLRMLGMG